MVHDKIIAIMMDENKDVFLAGANALKNIPQHLFWGIHLVRTYLMTDFSTTCSCAHLYTFLMTTPLSTTLSNPPRPFPQLRTYLIDGLFLNQKTNKNIGISCSLNMNIHPNKKFFTKK